jgi:hypothetical protein
MGHKTLLVVRWAKHVHGWKAKTDNLGPLCLQRGKRQQIESINRVQFIILNVLDADRRKVGEEIKAKSVTSEK